MIVSFGLMHVLIRKGIRFAIILSLVMGILKEVIYDYYLGYGTASIDDMLFNGLGIIIYLIIRKVVL